ncbi:hypothetical protein [Okeania sp. SIO2B3]|uniref:hypothetical protein n=1 Tax=Okeania sp. SIO2B3 TaxID=2607784 RepID=UPI0013BF3CDE|nr:hypothetical protein [Okeania sp. SIO2B3]NET42886.1 hypothetical protein [Okeania sp. SIO2B3]
MSLENIQLTISLSDPQLDEDRLQTDTRNILSEIKKFDGVQKANLMQIETAEPGAKSDGGFQIGTIIVTVITSECLRFLVRYLADHLYGKAAKMKVKGKGNDREVEVEIEGRNAKELNEEYEKVEPTIKKVING